MKGHTYPDLHRITNHPQTAGFDGGRRPTANPAEHGACRPLFHDHAGYRVPPQRRTRQGRATRARRGSLDGARCATLGHAVQDDMAACTACRPRLCVAVVSAVRRLDREPPGGGREGGCEHGAEDANGGRSPRAADPGRAGPCPLARSALTRSLFVLQVPGRFLALTSSGAQRLLGRGRQT